MKTFDIKLPSSLREGFLTISGIVIFGGRYFKEILKPPFETKELLKQLFEIGYKSISLIGITGFIIGLTLTMQSIPTFTKFGAASLVPSMVALSIVLEIGPVISALIFAGKIGSSIGAELGSMKVSEQIDAMEISGTNPFNYLAVTRITATTLMLPLLVIFSNAIAITGGYVAFSLANDISFKSYFINSFNSISYKELIPSVFKTGVFGFAIGVIGCYEGFNASRGTESVGIAANTAVVLSSLAVIIIDMINVQVVSILF